VRVWEISKGTCIRVVYGVSSQLCICFHPVSSDLAQCITVCPFYLFHWCYLSISLLQIFLCVGIIVNYLLYHIIFTMLSTTLLQVNNNLLLVGNANKEINVNFLTFCSQVQKLVYCYSLSDRLLAAWSSDLISVV